MSEEDQRCGGEETQRFAAERIQRTWRQYREAVVDFEERAAALPPAASRASISHGSVASLPSVNDLEEYETQLNDAAALLQRRWRLYRVAVVDASSEGFQFAEEDVHAANHGVRSPLPERSPTPARSSSLGGVGLGQPASEQIARQGSSERLGASAAAAAVSRIQRRWKQYRRAVATADRIVSDSHNTPTINETRATSPDVATGRSANAVVNVQLAAAAERIQRRWRRYVSALGPQDRDGPREHRVASASPAATSTRSTDVHAAAAHRIQRLWKRYRSALDRYEDTASTAGSTEHEAVAAAAETIQRRWRAYWLARREEQQDADASVDIGAPVGSSSSESVATSDDDNDDEPVDRPSDARRPAALPPAHVDADAALSPGSRARVEATPFIEPRTAAAALIQFWWRRREAVDDDAAPQPTLDRATAAIRVREALREQEEFQRLVANVRRRERDEAALRLQEAWRARRVAIQHRESVAHGRREAAARSIQNAVRRRLLAQGLTPAAPEMPISALRGALSRRVAQDRVMSSSGGGLPTCIVCLDEIVQIAIMPCGHAHLCCECANALRRCPACRVLIAVRLRIFL